MPGLIALCEQYFNCSDLYEVLEIEKNASDVEVKRAYRKLSLKVHPDRVKEAEKDAATEKFKVLSKVHVILSDKEKRAVYDSTGTVDEDDSLLNDTFDWVNYWKCVFKPISKKDISDYEAKYKGSETEEGDLRKAYLNGKGNMDFILESVPFTNCDEEPRLKKIIQRWIDNNEVPAFEMFTNESPAKAARRKRKWEKEAEEAARLSSTGEVDPTGEETLKLLIDSRQRERGHAMNDFFDQLAAKYGAGGKKKVRTPNSSLKRKRK